MNKNNKLELYDYLLIFGIVTAPMTQLRVVYVGISELLLFLFIISTFIKFKQKLIISKTSISILSLMVIISIGTIFGILRATSNDIQLYELFTFTFLFLMVLSLENYFLYKKGNNRIILKKILLYSFLIFGFLFFWSQVISSKFIFWDLYFGNVRLSLLAKNPHQLVRSSGVMIVLSIMFLYEEKKIFYILSTIVFTLISIQTDSSTFTASIVLMILIFVVSTVYKETNFVITFIICGLLLVLSLLNLDFILVSFKNFVENDPNGLDRLRLWKLAIKQIKQYPIFGNGFGPQLVSSPFWRKDVHNTYLDILLRGGITALISYLIIITGALKSSFKSSIWIFMIIVYFVLYGIAGVVMRNPIFWFFIFLANQKGDIYERKRN